ncbi:MAG: class I SAM-dependent RNA methyltransferase, partial [Spirochaetes bacterium]|nr:class I SAM-dependent RNA methyltransferase [Spirochaetota bacterium]
MEPSCKKKYNLIALCSFGLESIVERELQRLGIKDFKKENGMVHFSGDEKEIALCNIFLRVAERVVINMGGFHASDFDQLYEGTLAIAWEELIPQNGIIHVVGKSVRSKLTHVPSCQSIVKKSIIEAMKRKYPGGVFKEDGPLYKVQISLSKDNALLTVDTTGAGLHKRGYRTKAGEAPLKESLAAALVILSRVSFSSILADPLCGAGTIPIEAALFAVNKAPGMDRSFASEEWPQIPKSLWD